MQDQRLILLRKKGHRVTLSREMVLKALKPYPQSAKEIYEKLNKNTPNIDLTTVYRTLEFFSSENIVIKTQLDVKTTKYEFNNRDNHHHHLICEKCRRIKDITIDDNAFLERIIDKTNFLIKRHTLELWGLCPKCN
jgi:Fur family ferric uptake transcriptional regulator